MIQAEPVKVQNIKPQIQQQQPINQPIFQEQNNSDSPSLEIENPSSNSRNDSRPQNIQEQSEEPEEPEEARMRPIEISEVYDDDPIEIQPLIPIRENILIQNELNLSQHSIESPEENNDLKQPVRFNSSKEQILISRQAEKPDNYFNNSPRGGKNLLFKDEEMKVEQSPEQIQEPMVDAQPEEAKDEIFGEKNQDEEAKEPVENCHCHDDDDKQEQIVALQQPKMPNQKQVKSLRNKLLNMEKPRASSSFENKPQHNGHSCQHDQSKSFNQSGLEDSAEASKIREESDGDVQKVEEPAVQPGPIIDPDSVYAQIGGQNAIDDYLSLLNEKLQMDCPELHGKITEVASSEWSLDNLFTLICKDFPIDLVKAKETYQPLRVTEEEFDNLFS